VSSLRIDNLAEDRVIEFTIKGYPEHRGVTKALHGLKPGSRLLMSVSFGTIHYQGRGTFIAGGAGITPFMAILRELASTGDLDGHSLIFANKTPADIICEKELRHYLGVVRCRFLCTDVEASGGGMSMGKLTRPIYATRLRTSTRTSTCAVRRDSWKW